MPDEYKVIPADSDEGRKLNQLHELVRNIRGACIDQAIWIDVLVTDILAQYFCPSKEKRPLLISQVLTGRDSSFSGRLDVLQKIVKRSFSDFSKRHPNFFEQLDKLRRFRNRLAHARVDTSDAFIEKGQTDRIVLMLDEGGTTKTHVVTSNEARERLAEGSRIIEAILELRKLVSDAPA